MKRFKIRMESVGARLVPLPSPVVCLAGRSSPGTEDHHQRQQQQLLAASQRPGGMKLRSGGGATRGGFRWMMPEAKPAASRVVRKRKRAGVAAGKAAAGKPSKESGHKRCVACAATQTPQWRVGHNGATLCNACGVRYRRSKLPDMLHKKQEEKLQQQIPAQNLSTRTGPSRESSWQGYKAS